MTEAHVTNTAHLRGLTERVAHLEGKMAAAIHVMRASERRIAALETELAGARRILAEIKEALGARFNHR